MIGAVVGPLVSPVVDQVDVDDVVSRIDVDHVIQRVDLDGVLARVDVEAMLDRVDINQLFERVEIDAILDRVDINRLVERVEIDAILDRIDLDRILDRVDVNALAARIDLDAIVARVDINKVLERVDTDALVERTELGALIAHSTSGVFTKVLDVARSQVVTLDIALHGVVDLLARRRRRSERPAASPTDLPAPGAGASPALAAPAPPPPEADAAAAASPSPWRRDLDLQGHPAGGVSRLLAFVVDWFLIGVLFAVGEGLLSVAAEVVVGHSWEASDHRALSSLFFLIWAFVYFAVPIGVAGRTPGKALLGLKVVRVDGGPVNPGHAALRTLILPFSFLVFGIGLLLGLFRADRRTLHDLGAGTHEVYDWDARGAELRLLAERQHR